MEKGYWDFITRNEREPVLPNAPNQQGMQAFKGWHKRARKVMYWLSISILDSMCIFRMQICQRRHGIQIGRAHV